MKFVIVIGLVLLFVVFLIKTRVDYDNSPEALAKEAAREQAYFDAGARCRVDGNDLNGCINWCYANWARREGYRTEESNWCVDGARATNN